MDVIESLQTGRFGITLRLPSYLEVCQDDGTCAQLIDKPKNLAWFFFLLPGLRLDLCPQHRADMRTSLEYYARSMFEEVFQQLDRGGRNRQPRTADPAWSPLVDVEYLSIGGAEALRTVHRMAYEPGDERIMGHVLIPLQQGLFEARVLSIDQMTGYRESVLGVKWIHERALHTHEEIEQMRANLRQAHFDEPRHDETFPNHSLSRARAALSWLCRESNVRVTEVAPPLDHNEVELPHLDCSLVPPPRFVYSNPQCPAQEASFHRVSFCGTDGVESLYVNRWNDVDQDAATHLPHVAKSIAETIHEESGVQETQLIVKKLAGHEQRPRALVIVEGNGHRGLLRNAMLFFQDAHQTTWSLSRFGTAAVPRDALIAELTEAARSFRIGCFSRREKPWWKFW